MNLSPTEMLDIIMCLKKGISIESWLKSKHKNISVELVSEKLKREYGVNDKLLLLKGNINNVMDITKAVSNEIASKVPDIIKHPLKTIDTIKSINVPEEVAVARYNICLNCPNLIDDRCKLCGCVMKAKSRLSTMECLDNRWKDIK